MKSLITLVALLVVLSCDGAASFTGKALFGQPPCDPPAITTQPASLTCLTNATTNFVVVATGTALTYQWKTNGVNVINNSNYFGATDSTLWVSNSPITYSNLSYTVAIAGQCGSVNSSAAIQTVTNGAGGGDGAGTNIINGLVAFYKLGEASGTRSDSTSRGNDTTDHGTITLDNATGKIGNAANFTIYGGGTHQWLDHADNADLSVGNLSYMVWCWVKWDGGGSRRFFVGKSDSGASVIEYSLEYFSSTDRYRFGHDTTFLEASTHGSPALDNNVWTLIVGWYDATGHTLNIKVNTEASDSTSHTGGTDGTGGFAIGRLGDFDGLYFDQTSGLIDAVGLSKCLPDSNDLSWLWNGGAGRELP